MSERPFKLGEWVTGSGVISGRRITGVYDGDDRDYALQPGESVVLEYDEYDNPSQRVVATQTLELAERNTRLDQGD